MADRDDDSSAALAATPQQALADYIAELESDYLPWYERAAARNFWSWFIAQGIAFLAGVATSILAAVMNDDAFKGYTWGRLVLIVLPALGSIASTFFVQMRVAEFEDLREQGRAAIQRLIAIGKQRYAGATSPETYSEVHGWLIDEVSKLEAEQNRRFQILAPRPRAGETGKGEEAER